MVIFGGWTSSAIAIEHVTSRAAVSPSNVAYVFIISAAFSNIKHLAAGATEQVQWCLILSQKARI